jgi:hypothetical protein
VASRPSWVPPVTEEVMVATRISVHGLAEHVFAATERRATGSIRLYVREATSARPTRPTPRPPVADPTTSPNPTRRPWPC